MLILLSVLIDAAAIGLAIGRAEKLCSILSLWILLYLAVLAILFVLAVLSLVYFLRRFRRYFLSACFPLFLNVSTLLIVTLLPLERIPIHARFLSNLTDYTRVVAFVEEGTLSPGFEYSAWLPEEYQRLSNNGGQILVQKDEEATRVFFFAYGCCFCYAGYMYRSSGEPQAADFGYKARDWHCDWQERPHWWYCDRLD